MPRRFALTLLTALCLAPIISLAADAWTMAAQERPASQGYPQGGPDAFTISLNLVVPNVATIILGFFMRKAIREAVTQVRADLTEKINGLDDDVEQLTTTTNTNAQDIARLDERVAFLRPPHKAR